MRTILTLALLFSVLSLDAGRRQHVFDGKAQNYIHAVNAQIADMSWQKFSSLHDWFLKGRDEGWYAEIGYIAFATWNNETANAIFVQDPTDNGTFVNSPTHASGYVKGNASTQYFDFNQTFGDAGVTLGDGAIYWDIASGQGSGASNAGCDVGAEDSATQAGTGCLDFDSAGTEYLLFNWHNQGNRLLVASHGYNDGLTVCQYLSGGRQGHRTANGSTIDTIGTDATGEFGTVSTMDVYAMAANDNGSAAAHDDAGYRMFGYGTSFTAAQRDDFMAATMETLDIIDD